jgi:hypothetical protein
MRHVRPGLIAVGLFFSIYAGIVFLAEPKSLYEVRWVFYSYVILGIMIWLYSLVILLVLIWRHHPEKIRHYIPYYDTWIGDFFVFFWILWFIPHLISLRYQVDPHNI